MENLINLTVLDVRHNELIDISVVQNMEKLVDLYIRKNVLETFLHWRI